MAYQVLARKWRPRDFRSLIGQEHVVRALRHALENQRLHHAYLFTGTRGVGKTTLARILAKCLNCETGVTAQPCGSCGACREIDSGRFVDLMEVDAATNTRVDEMRQLLDTAQYAPTRARFKVYVIDEVHMLSTSAFNAMLKTLEEPPEHLKFILATTDPQKIPVTVLSRCLQFNLKQMPAASIVAHLEEILRSEGVEFEAGALALIGRAASGSMRDALSLLDQAIAHGAGRISTAGVGEMLGTIDQDFAVEILESVVSGNVPAALEAARAMNARSLSFEAALVEIAGLLLRIALAQAGGIGPGDDETHADRIGALARRLDPEVVQLLYEIALQGRRDLALAPDAHAGFVMSLLRMIAFRPESDAGGELPVDGRPGAAHTGGRPVAARKANPDGGGWVETVRALRIGGAARELARNAELLGVADGVFELSLPRAKAHLADRAYLEKLRTALQEHYGREVTVRVAVADARGTSLAAEENRATATRQEKAARSVHEDPFVRDLVDLFDARVLDSTIRPADHAGDN